MGSDSTLRDTAILAILGQEGDPVGVGFLLEGNLVLTCAHVVNAAFGLPDEAVDQPEKPLLVARAIPRSETVAARVAHWRPIADTRGDVAVLQLEQSIPESTVAPLIDVVSTVGHTFLAFGFPRGQPDGMWATGNLLPCQGKGWAILQSVLQTGLPVEEGFSGSPVWDESVQGFVGMVVSKDLAVAHRSAFMMPIALIQREWDGLRPLVQAAGSAPAIRGATRLLQAIRLPKHIVGHEHVLRELVARLKNPNRDAPILQVIVGAPGTGKSTLALAAAVESASAYTGGQFYIDMRGTETRPLEIAAVLPDLLQRLGVAPTHLPSTMDEQEALYQEKIADREVLLFLDNVVRESQVRSLLPAVGLSACVITARAVLPDLQDVDLLRLDVLPEAAAIQLLQSSLSPDQLATASHPILAEIAALCGFLPLALQIVVSKLRNKPHWSTAILRDELKGADNLLDVLSLGQRQVRAAFELSYSGLQPTDKVTFRRLGVLRGGDFSSWLAGPLSGTSCNAGSQSVERLVDSGLAQPMAVDAAGRMRYRLHDLLRTFARERAATEDSQLDIELSIDNLLASYHAITEVTEERLNPQGLRRHTQRASFLPADLARTHDNIDPTSWFAAEKMNLINAVALAWDYQRWVPCWQLANGLVTYLAWGDRWDDYREALETAVLASRRAADGLAEAYSLRNLGLIHLYEHRQGEAEICLQQARLLFELRHETHWLAVVLRDIGDLRRQERRYAEAVDLFDLSMTTLIELGDELGVAYVQRSLADIAQLRGDSGKATAYAKGAISVLSNFRDYRATAEATSTLASALCMDGDWPNARAAFYKAIGFAAMAQDRYLEGRILTEGAMRARHAGDLDQARAWFDRGKTIQPEPVI